LAYIHEPLNLKATNKEKEQKSRGSKEILGSVNRAKKHHLAVDKGTLEVAPSSLINPNSAESFQSRLIEKLIAT